MQNNSTLPVPPQLETLAWRDISAQDLDAIVALARACLATDGGLGFLFGPDYLKGFYFDGPTLGTGAFLPDGSLAAAITAHIIGAAGSQRARLTGQVHPAWRQKGLGAFLMYWGQAQAQNLLSRAGISPAVMQVATESRTEVAHNLYLAHGFQNIFDEYVMERDLRQPLPEMPLPAGVMIATWQPERAQQFFRAYHNAFRDRPGFPGYSAEEWITSTSEDDLKPDWTLLASLEGEPVGFVTGDMDLTTDPVGGYINQVGVVPSQRRRGLASALMIESMRRMQRDGSQVALLTVHLNNPGAIAAYLGLGFRIIGRRARYEKSV